MGAIYLDLFSATTNKKVEKNKLLYNHCNNNNNNQGGFHCDVL